MPSITSANVANAIVKLVAADALPALVGNLVMGNLVNRDYEPTLAQAGDTVNVPIAPQLVANNIAEGGAVQPQNPSLSNAQIVLNTHAEATFQIPDVTKVLAVPDLLRVYMQPAVIAIAERIESDLMNLYAGFTANTPLGIAGTPMTEAVIDQAETALFQARVPSNWPKYPDRRQQYLFGDAADSAFQRIPERRAKPVCGRIIDGTIGKIKDFFVFRSQYVQATGSSPLNTHNLAFERDAIGLVVRRLPQPLPGTGAIAEYAELGNFGMRVTMSYQPNTLSQQFTVDVLYGCAVLRNNHAVQINS